MNHELFKWFEKCSFLDRVVVLFFLAGAVIYGGAAMTHVRPL